MFSTVAGMGSGLWNTCLAVAVSGDKQSVTRKSKHLRYLNLLSEALTMNKN